MKQILNAVYICIAVLTFLITSSVSAAAPTPTHTPTPTIQPAVPTPTPVKGSAKNSSDLAKEIPNNIPNRAIQLGESDTTEEGIESAVKYTAHLPSINPNMNDFKIPEMEAMADWLKETHKYMTAKQIKDNIDEHQDNLFVSGKARRCISLFGVIIPLPFTVGNLYETEDIPYMARLLTYTRELTAHEVRYNITPIGGRYTFMGEPYKLPEDTEVPCDYNLLGTIQLPKIVQLVKGLLSFDAFTSKSDSKQVFEDKIVSKQQTPEAERMHCTMNGCVTDNADIDLEYLTKDPLNPPDEKARLEKSGGLVDSGFRAIFMDTKKKESEHGAEPNFTDTNTLRTRQLENSEHLIKCSLIPPAQRLTIGLTDPDCMDFIQDL